MSAIRSNQQQNALVPRSKVRRLRVSSDHSETSREELAERTEAELIAQFKRFFIPEFAIDGATPNQVMDAISAAFTQYRGNEGGVVPIKFEADAADFADTNPISFATRGKSVWDLLQMLAALSNGTIEIDGTSIKLLPFAEQQGDQEIVTRTFSVPPDFRQGLGDFVFGSDSQPAIDDPFGDSPATQTSTASIEESLHALGLNSDESLRLGFDESTSQLTVRSSVSQQRRMDQLIDALSSNGMPQVYMTTKLIQLPGDQFTEDTLIPAPEYQELIRDYMTENEVELSSAPSIVTRSGQRAKVEIVRELIMPDSEQQGEFIQHQIGLILEVDPVLEGEEVRATGSLDIRLPPGTTELATGLLTDTLQGNFVEDFDENGTVTSFETEFDALIHDGMTACLRCEGSNDSTETLAFITLQLLDPAGKPIDQ